MVLFFEYLKKYKGLLFLALLLAAINQTFSLLDPQIIRLITDNYALRVSELSTEEFIKGTGILVLGLVGVALASRIAKNFQDYYVNVLTQKIGTEMYANSIKHTFSLPFEVFEDRRSGEVLQKLQKARTDSEQLIQLFVNVIFLSLVGFIFVLGYSFYVHWSIGAAFLFSLPVMTLFIFSISSKIKAAQKIIVAESAELSGSTTETIRNVELVKSLGLEEQEVSRLNRTNEKILNLELKKVKLIRILSFIQGTLVNAVRCGLLFLMLFLLLKQLITLGEFLTLFFYSFYLFSPLSELATVISKYQEARASNEELKKILSIPSKEKPKNPINIEKIETVEMQNVCFNYATSNKASVSNINFKIKNPQTVAFVGLSGSGKTTLIKLILGLYEPTKGKILFNGKKSSDIDFDNLRNKIGLVSQDTQLFAGTLRENLLFVNPSATDEDCINVLKMSAASNLLERGKGLDAKIGEGGIKLSGGEKQRLAIARALLRNPQIMIFDEATSSLDSLTEKEITKTIQKISKSSKNLISIIIAHRLSTVSHADKICVMEKGQIIEEGTHQELLRKKGLYSALWREQIGETNN